MEVAVEAADQKMMQTSNLKIQIQKVVELQSGRKVKNSPRRGLRRITLVAQLLGCNQTESPCRSGLRANHSETLKERGTHPSRSEIAMGKGCLKIVENSPTGA